MGDLSPARVNSSICILGILPALVVGLLSLTWLSADLAAQSAGKKPPTEEEEPTRPKIKPPPVVDDEPAEPKTKPKPKTPDKESPKPARPREEVEEKGARPKYKVPPEKPASRPAEDQPGDLAEALRQTKNPELQELYRGVMTPHDSITIASSGRTYHVDPLTQYYPGEHPKFTGGFLHVRPFDQDWKPSTRFDVGSGSARSIQPFEEIVTQRIDEFLQKSLDKLNEQSKSYLPRKDMLRSAEMVLAATERFHVSARERGIREGEEWEPVAEQLRRKLFEVRLQQLALNVAAGEWESAAEQARHMAKAYARAEERERIAQPLVHLIQQGLKDDNEETLTEAHNRLRELEEYCPNSAVARPVAEALRSRAQGLYEESRRLRQAGKPQEALVRMRLAQEIWPRLPGLRDEWLRVNNSYPILRVAVRDLPVNLLPSLAATDVERQAVELLFESLVRVRYDPDLGQRYQPVLAERLPRLVPLGREFRLIRNAYWSNDEPVSAADVAATVRFLNEPNGPGFTPGLGKVLVEKPQLGGDAFRVVLNLKQGYLDPLSLMTFKILPRQMAGQAASRWNTQPIGSGPFRYEGQTTIEGSRAARFMANANYGSRDGKGNLPHIREIQFIQFTDTDEAVKAMQAGKIDLIPDLPAARVKELRDSRAASVAGPLMSRRVYFLAINHRRPQLQNPALRRALALAIDREKLLDDYFRGGLGKGVHRPLNSPFPAGSWACNPKIPADLFHLTHQAKALIHRAAEKGSGPPWQLSLKYPRGEPEVEAALQYLRDQVRNEIQVELLLEPTEPHQLRLDVEQTHSFDLAYYHHDHTSEVYWLWPLFDPNGTESGGGNYMGYVDAALASLLGQALGYRDFGPVDPKISNRSSVLQTTHLIHEHLDRQMPLIPLWQRDVFVVHRREVKPTSLDPLVIFSDVEKWTKELN
jgi:ABC-type transport system substrate-binding protein